MGHLSPDYRVAHAVLLGSLEGVKVRTVMFAFELSTYILPAPLTAFHRSAFSYVATDQVINRGRRRRRPVKLRRRCNRQSVSIEPLQFILRSALLRFFSCFFLIKDDLDTSVGA